MTHAVLLVEDDPLIARTLRLGLRHHGFDVTAAASLAEATQLVASDAFHLALLDLTLPDGSGLDLCGELRRRAPTMPVIVVTARTEEPAAVEAFGRGADDYVRKPFGLEELAARMHRLVALREAAAMPATGVRTLGTLRLDPQRREAAVGEVPLKLTRREFDALELLMRADGRVVTREAIVAALADADGIFDRTIDSHLSHLRRKLREAGAPARLAAVYGVGYRLDPE